MKKPAQWVLKLEAMKIKEMSLDERPREKMYEKGASALSNAELLAIILRTGTGRKNALDLARELLKASGGSLLDLAGASIDKMTKTEGIGRMKALTICAALELGRRFISEKAPFQKVAITNAGMVYKIMNPLLKGLMHEECWVLFLNRANFIIYKEKASAGGSSSTIIDTKRIVSKALEKMACGLILVHNHPSGNPRPGRADIEQTEILKKALVTFDISLIDHVIISDDRFFSFADERVEISE